MTLIEMEGFLRGKCLPGDLKVGETNAQYLHRKLNAASDLHRKHDDLVITSATVISELQRKVEALAVECHSAKTLLGKIHGESYDSDHEFGKSVYEKDTNFELQDFIENQSEVGTSTPVTDVAIAEIEARGVEKFADHYLCPDIDEDIRDFAQKLRKEPGK